MMPLWCIYILEMSNNNRKSLILWITLSCQTDNLMHDGGKKMKNLILHSDKCFDCPPGLLYNKEKLPTRMTGFMEVGYIQCNIYTVIKINWLLRGWNFGYYILTVRLGGATACVVLVSDNRYCGLVCITNMSERMVQTPLWFEQLRQNGTTACLLTCRANMDLSQVTFFSTLICIITDMGLLVTMVW